MIQVFIEVLEKVFVQVCNSQGCGMVVAKTVFLLTQQVVFGKIIKSSVQYLFKYFWKLCQNWYRFENREWQYIITPP